MDVATSSSATPTKPPRKRTPVEIGGTFMIFALMAIVAALNGAAFYYRNSLYADVLIGDMEAGLLILGVFVFVFRLREIRIRGTAKEDDKEIEFEL